MQRNSRSAEVLERHFFNKLWIINLFLEWEEVSEGLPVQEDEALFVDLLAEEDEENVKDQHRTRNILKDRR